MPSCFFLFSKSCQKSTSSDVLAFSIGTCQLFIAESSVRLGLRCPKTPKRVIHHNTIQCVYNGHPPKAQLTWWKWMTGELRSRAWREHIGQCTPRLSVRALKRRKHINMKQQTNLLPLVSLILTAQRNDAGLNEHIHAVSQYTLEQLLQLQLKEKYPAKVPDID